MLESKPSQFTLSPEAKILWQEKLNNPLPGVEVAELLKGDHPLKPKIVITTKADIDHDKLNQALSFWLNTHFMTVLEPLILLGANSGEAEDPVQQISNKVYDGLGVVPREDIESFIEKLDPEKRTVLRGKKIRLGPVLVFIPALNKPAAVKLRGLLWCLYNGQTLPAKVPADGIVSCKIEQEGAQEGFYRSIGYPLFGGRAVRIDMLDRVISSIYDTASGGVFSAKHEMAEWLGTPIEDLYKILESMGHTKIEEAAAVIAEVPAAEEVKSEATPAGGDAAVSVAPTPQQKPALAKFRLKRGKASQKQTPRPAKKEFTQRDKKKPEQNARGADKDKFARKSESGDRKDFKRKDKKHNKDKFDNREPRVITIEPRKKNNDSPFAVLQQLIVKSDG